MYDVQNRLRRFSPMSALSGLAVAAVCLVGGCNSNESGDHHVALSDFGTGQDTGVSFARRDAEPPKARKVTIAKPQPKEKAAPKTPARSRTTPAPLRPVAKVTPKPVRSKPKQPAEEKKVAVQTAKPAPKEAPPQPTKPASDTQVALADKPESTPDKEKKKAGGRPKLAEGTGGFAGTIKYDGTPPAPKDIYALGQAPKDPAVCGAIAIPNQSLIVNQKNNGVKNVFVYLRKKPKGYKGKGPKDSIVFDQKFCVFFPRNLIVHTNQTVLVKNEDPIVHNTHTYPASNPGFNSAIGASDRKGVPLTYRRAERYPVKVVCDLHSWMMAHHLVLDHPFCASTDENGEFAIAGLPPGKYSFIVWQETPGLLERKLSVTVKAGAYTEKALSYSPDKFAEFKGPRPKVLTVSTGR